MIRETASARVLLVFRLLCAAFAAACSDSAEPIRVLVGDYSLMSYGGLPLPVDLGAIPDRLTGESTNCRLVITDGHLHLAAEVSSFAYAYDVRNSCSQQLMSRPTSSGSYRQDGDALFFDVPARDTTFHFAGHIVGTSITVDHEGTILRFQR